jgi:hypothetical protein
MPRVIFDAADLSIVVKSHGVANLVRERFRNGFDRLVEHPADDIGAEAFSGAAPAVDIGHAA